MTKIVVVLTVALLGSVALTGLATAKPLTEVDVARLIGEKGEEIANIGAAKAQARLLPMVNSLSDTLNFKTESLSLKLSDLGKEVEILGQQLGLLQAGMTNVQTAVQGSGGEISNLRLVVDEAMRKQESELSKKVELERLKANERLADQNKQIEDLKARLEKRSIFGNARALLEIGMAGLLIYHVLDHDGR